MSAIRMSIKEFNLPLFIEFIEKVRNCGNDTLIIEDYEEEIFYNSDIHRILIDIHIRNDANKTIVIKGKGKTLYIGKEELWKI